MALLNNSLTFLSLSPTHIVSISGPFTDMKFAPDSFATAFASKVFPVPGGPYNNIPFGGVTPILSNASGDFKGHSIISFNACFTSSRPPMSLHLTFGISTKTSLIAEGSTIFNALSKSSLDTTNFSTISLGSSSSAFHFISGNTLLNADIAASFANAHKSAPT